MLAPQTGVSRASSSSGTNPPSSSEEEEQFRTEQDGDGYLQTCGDMGDGKLVAEPQVN